MLENVETYFPGEPSQAQLCFATKIPFRKFNLLSFMWIQLYTQVRLSSIKLHNSLEYFICVLKVVTCVLKLCKNIGVKELKTWLLHRLPNASHNGLGKLQIQTPLDLLLVVVGMYWILSKLLASLILCISCWDMESLGLFFCFACSNTVMSDDWLCYTRANILLFDFNAICC